MKSVQGTMKFHQMIGETVQWAIWIVRRHMAIRSTIRTELPPNFSLLFCHSDGIIKQHDGDCHTK